MLKAGLTAGVFLASMSVAAIAQDKSVVVYTAHKASIVDALVPKFEKDTGIKVDVVKAGSGDIIKRVKAEILRTEGRRHLEHRRRAARGQQGPDCDL